MWRFSESLVVLICLALSGEGKLQRLPLKGDLHDGYSLSMYVGVPAMKVEHVMLDTGSTITLFPCSTCLKCNGKQEDLYDPQISFTNSKIKCVCSAITQNSNEQICAEGCTKNQQYCQYTTAYSQGTIIMGQIYKDNISLTNSTEDMFRSFFGCIEVQDSVHDQERPGSIMGLGPSPSSNILFSYFDERPEAQYTFSTCYAKTDGFFQVGPNREDKSFEPILISRFKGDSLYYLTQLDSMTFGSADILTAVNHDVIVDTGSTNIVFPPNVYLMAINEINERCMRSRMCQLIQFAEIQNRYFIAFANEQSLNIGSDRPRYPNKNQGTDVDSILPALQITSRGKKHTLKGSHYINKLKDSDSVYLIAFDQSDDYMILGIVWQQNKKIVFNIHQQIITVYDNYNCTYTPFEQSIFPDFIVDIIFFLKSVSIQYYIIFSLSLILLIILLIRFSHKIKSCCSILKNSLIHLCKRKKRKRVKKVIQLNQQVTSKEDVGNQSTESVGPAPKTSDLPHKYKRRGRGGVIRNR